MKLTQKLLLVALVFMFSAGYVNLVKAEEISNPETTQETTLEIAPETIIETPSTSVIVQESINLIIRDGSTEVFSGQVDLPDVSAPDVTISPTDGSASVGVPARSVLAILDSVQQTSSAFKITDLSYFSAYDSFLINCIAVPASSSTPDCYNWTNAINTSYPQIGVDDQILTNGDTLYLFFGPSHQTVVSKSSVVKDEAFTVKAEQYDLASGNYIPLTGVSLGIGTLNPDYSFTEIQTALVDINGQATFSLSQIGSFQVGIKEDYYFPTVSITVTDTPPASGGGGSGGSGDGSGGITHLNFNIDQALAFISASQNTDGSFASQLATDWTALAFSAADSGSAKSKLRSYLLNAKPKMQTITDYERYAMALQAMGINPATGTSVNYIAPILQAFDGTQIGSTYDNDDIFGLLVLAHNGYTSSDEIIKKVIAHVLASQNSNGSWNSSVDMTSAAIQALSEFSNVSGVNSAITKAISYLKSTQKADAGWDNIDSTSWAQTAINRLIEKSVLGSASESDWAVASGLYPTDALAKSQDIDGGVQSSNRVWSTSYAVVAASGKSWNTILGNFPKPTSTTTDIPPTTPPVVPPILPIPTTQEPLDPILFELEMPKDELQKPVAAKIASNEKVANVTPAVLGDSTFVPSETKVGDEEQQGQNSQQQPEAKNIFLRLWEMIISFFKSLF